MVDFSRVSLQYRGNVFFCRVGVVRRLQAVGVRNQQRRDVDRFVYGDSHAIVDPSWIVAQKAQFLLDMNRLPFSSGTC